jgi:type IV pilus assembly protein PilC
MARFRYTATTEDGKTVRGEVESEHSELARQLLLQDNLDVQNLRETRTRTLSAKPKHTRVSRVEIMRFSRGLAAFVRAGVPITDGLRVMAESTNNKAWRAFLIETRDKLAQGMQLSDVLATRRELFPPYYLGIIESAELTGRLDVALDQVSGYIDREIQTRSKISAALIYPMIVLGMAVTTITVLTVWVLPKFAAFFEDLGANLPASTSFLIKIANVTSRFWWMLPVLIVGALALGAWVKTTERGRRAASAFALRVPLVRGVAQCAAVERVCRVLGAMIESGVPVSDAMTAAARSSNNSSFERGLQKAQARMLAGEGLAGPFADTKLFPPGAIELIRVGEQSGTLELQLEAVADFYLRELEDRLRRLTTAFEPIILVVMGVVVGFVAIALVQAMYGVYQSNALNK